MAKAQRKLCKLEKGTKERKKQGKVVDRYQYVCIEDLNIKKMIEGSTFAKSIVDASWNQFVRYLFYKAAEAGRKIGLVNPAYTTQECFKCS